jgi:hypothetical protein
MILRVSKLSSVRKLMCVSLVECRGNVIYPSLRREATHPELQSKNWPAGASQQASL